MACVNVRAATKVLVRCHDCVPRPTKRVRFEGSPIFVVDRFIDAVRSRLFQPLREISQQLI